MGATSRRNQEITLRSAYKISIWNSKRGMSLTEYSSTSHSVCGARAFGARYQSWTCLHDCHPLHVFNGKTEIVMEVPLRSVEHFALNTPVVSLSRNLSRLDLR